VDCPSRYELKRYQWLENSTIFQIKTITSIEMGRRTDMDNDDDEQQSTTSSSSSTRMAHESQINPNRNLDEDKSDDDPLIHDTILPHRKRVRRDTLLSIQQQYYIQPQQSESSSTCDKIHDVSLISSINSLLTL
jgi:hypothetical protein